MSSKRQPRGAARPDRRPEPRLYLFTPPPTESGNPLLLLESALAEADVACVLAASHGAAPAAPRTLLLDLAAVTRRHGAALLASDPELARAAGIDGAHIRGGGPALEAALALLKPEFIVGASGLGTRHDAMEAGERDIDYLLFGEPSADGYTPPLEDTLERVSWWAEIFTIPCVAFAPRLEDVAALAAAGADFIALGSAIWADSRGPAAAAREAEERAIAAVSAA